MREITAYESADGRVFFSREACEKNDREWNRVNAIMSKLPNDKPHHGRYKLRDVDILRTVKWDLWSLVLERFGADYPQWRAWDASEVHPQSIVGRVLDGDSPLDRAWHRLACYDFNTGREYDQPYFVSHPEKAVLDD